MTRRNLAALTFALLAATAAMAQEPSVKFRVKLLDASETFTGANPPGQNPNNPGETGSNLTLTGSAGPGQTVNWQVQDAAFTAGGGTAPYQYQTVSSSDPGLHVDPTTGAISGMPTTSGQHTIQATATDSSTPPKTTPATTVTFQVTPQLSISPVPTQAQQGAFYSYALAASGGTAPYTYAHASGTLPPGTRVTGSQIQGTPTAQGTYAGIVISATDSLGRSVNSSPISMTVMAPTPHVPGRPIDAIPGYGSGLWSPSAPGPNDKVDRLYDWQTLTALSQDTTSVRISAGSQNDDVLTLVWDEDQPIDCVYTRHMGASSSSEGSIKIELLNAQGVVVQNLGSFYPTYAAIYHGTNRGTPRTDVRKVRLKRGEGAYASTGAVFLHSVRAGTWDGAKCQTAP